MLTNKYDLPHLLIPVITFTKPFSFLAINLSRYFFRSITAAPLSVILRIFALWSNLLYHCQHYTSIHTFGYFAYFYTFFVLSPYPFLLFMCSLGFNGSLFFVYCESNFDIEIKTTAQCWRKTNDCAVVFLTTCYPTSKTGTGGDNENKSVKENAVLSGNG